jgi:hypothetical protein
MKVFINNKPFPYELEKKLSKLLIKSGDYSKLEDKDLEKIKIFLKKKEIEYNIIPSNAIIRSIRSAYMNERELINHRSFNKYKKIIIKDFFKYNDIFKVSKKYDFSPIKILKYILQYHKLSKNNIILILHLSAKKEYKTIKKKFPFNDKFLQNIKKVIDNDVFNTISQDKIKQYADAFERKLEYAVDNVYKIKYKTEGQLVIEQTETYGRPILTPDILLLQDLYINNKKINWIDAKNYYGANTILIKKNLTKQIDKYYDKLGSGAIVFNLGYSSKLEQQFDNNKIIFISFIDFEKIK